MPWEAVLFAIVSLGFTAAAWWRAGRATQLAERSERRAITAEDRAEEAHAILQERSATEKERMQAELDAPPIADGWRSQIKLAAQAAQTGRGNRDLRGHVMLTVKTLAEHLALRIIRSEEDALGVVELVQLRDEARVSVLTPYQLNQKRARERR